MRIKLTVIILCFITSGYAQREVQFTMFWNNVSMYNPAATGLFYKHYASVCGRHCANDFTGKGQPITAGAVYDFKWNKINSGIGVNYIYDQLGFEKNNEVNLNYSYQLTLKEDRILSAGISGGILNKSIDFSKFVYLDPNDPSLNKKHSDNSPNIKLGFMFKTPRFLVGISVMQLNKPKSELLSFEGKRYYYFNVSYNIPISNSFEITPRVFVKSDFTSIQEDVNLMVSYKKRIWAGMSYRPTDAVAFMAGVDIKGKYRIGYSYSYIKSKLPNYSHGTHEIVMSLLLPCKNTN